MLPILPVDASMTLNDFDHDATPRPLSKIYMSVRSDQSIRKVIQVVLVNASAVSGCPARPDLLIEAHAEPHVSVQTSCEAFAEYLASIRVADSFF